MKARRVNNHAQVGTLLLRSLDYHIACVDGTGLDLASIRNAWILRSIVAGDGEKGAADFEDPSPYDTVTVHECVWHLEFAA